MRAREREVVWPWWAAWWVALVAAVRRLWRRLRRGPAASGETEGQGLSVTRRVLVDPPPTPENSPRSRQGTVGETAPNKKNLPGRELGRELVAGNGYRVAERGLTRWPSEAHRTAGEWWFERLPRDRQTALLYRELAELAWGHRDSFVDAVHRTRMSEGWRWRRDALAWLVEECRR